MLCARVSPLLVAVAAFVAAPCLAAGQATTQSRAATRAEAVGHTASVSARAAGSSDSNQPRAGSGSWVPGSAST